MRLNTTSATLVASTLISTATAMQPDAAKPQPGPMRNLTWGQLNFLHTTDTHGWLGGHVAEYQYAADWGDYVSFAEHMRKRADKAGVDVILVDTGDRVEGNGLYDGSDPKGLYTYDIYRQQDVDIICSGNHELYVAATADREQQIQIPNFKSQYISSNLDYLDPATGERRPFAQRYREFKTKNLGLHVLAFGFMFDFTGNANNTIVQPVEETIEEPWFQEAIRKKPDVFVVTGHVGLRMPELKAIYTAIRKQNWHIPIAIFAGHAHVRDATEFDSRAVAMASGRYFETVGWMSIDGLIGRDGVSDNSNDDVAATGSSVSFSRRYLDNNLYGYQYHSGVSGSHFATEKGKKTTDMIYEARKKLHLSDLIGCAPKDLWMNRVGYPHENSIYSWFSNESLPGIFSSPERQGKPTFGYLNTGGVRFDIVSGRFTSDSLYNVLPFTSKIVGIKDVPYKVGKKIIDILNSSGPILSLFGGKDLDVRALGQPEGWAGKDLTQEAPESTDETITSGNLQQVVFGKPSGSLTPGYTTKDDISDDGDDTEHAPIGFYQVPNAIASEYNFEVDDKGKRIEPETVDLVFIDFLKPWILAAVKFAGGDSTEADIVAWKDGTFSENLRDWIAENWKGEC